MSIIVYKSQEDLLILSVSDSGAGPEDAGGGGGGGGDSSALPSGLGGASSGGKYVPPSMRGAGGTRIAGDVRGGPGNRDDLPTLRVTNISEDTQENDLRELFGIFGRVARVYVGRDRETGAGKGFAFVSFEERAVAQKAMEKVNGKGYDSLILSVQWSRKFHASSSTCVLLTRFYQNLGRREDEGSNFIYCLFVFQRQYTCLLQPSSRFGEENVLA